MKLQLLFTRLLRGSRLLLWHSLAVAVVAFSVAKPCQAERIVLVRPTEGVPILSEVFNRLQGELRMQGFDTILASATGLPSAEEMRRVAELGQAAASIALEQSDLDLMAHVWFLDRETAQSRVLSIAVPQSDETPTILALRTVELLRSSLRERGSLGGGGLVLAPSTPTSLKALPSARAASPEVGHREDASRLRLDLRLEGTLLWNSLGQSALLAPALSLGYRLLPGWALAARILAPVATNRVASTDASAEIRVLFALAESRWSVPSGHSKLEFEPLVACGVARFWAKGHGEFPIQGREATGWTLATGLGLGAWFSPDPQWSVGGTLRAGALLPKPVVRVSQHDEVLGRPWLDIAIGVNHAF